REVAIAGHELFDADERNVHARRRQAEAGVALIGDEHEAPAFDRDEVGARQADVRLQVFLAEERARPPGDRRGVVVVSSEALALETLRDLPAVLVDDRPDDVAGMVVVDLDDEFTEVRLQRLNTMLLEERRQPDLFA